MDPIRSRPGPYFRSGKRYSRSIDLNADVGEGAATDAQLIPLVTSVNISCGGHAGTVENIDRAITLAKRHRVRIGAHVGYEDREHFGRRELPLPLDAVKRLCEYQIGALVAYCELRKCEVTHMKPHGALYNQAITNRPLSVVMARVCRRRGLAYVGLASTINDLPLAHVSRIREGFADRRYRLDGTLVPRSEPDALLHDPKEIAEQVEWLIEHQQVQTICVHGDTPDAVDIVRTVRHELARRKIVIEPFL